MNPTSCPLTPEERLQRGFGYLTPREFCSFYRISMTTYYELLAEGKGPCVTNMATGSRRRLPRIAVEDALLWAESRRTQ